MLDSVESRGGASGIESRASENVVAALRELGGSIDHCQTFLVFRRFVLAAVGHGTRPPRDRDAVVIALLYLVATVPMDGGRGSDGSYPPLERLTRLTSENVPAALAYFFK